VNAFAADAPDDLGITIAARLAPPMPALLTEVYGNPVVMLLLGLTESPARLGRRSMRRCGASSRARTPHAHAALNSE
jgi:hypothetical protein